MDWKKIEDYDYSINQNGEIRNNKTGNIIKPRLSKNTYYIVNLRKILNKKLLKFIDY